MAESDICPECGETVPRNECTCPKCGENVFAHQFRQDTALSGENAELWGGKYYHDAYCNASRNVPMGHPKSGCSCVVVQQRNTARAALRDELAAKDMRPQLNDRQIAGLKAAIAASLDEEIHRKGKGVFLSSHESLGVIEEEMHELREAVRGGNLDHVRKELLDIAVAAMWAIGSLDSGRMHWPKE